MPILLFGDDEIQEELTREVGWTPIPDGWYKATFDMSKAAPEMTGEEGRERLDGPVLRVRVPKGEGGDFSERNIRKNLFKGDIIRIAKVLGQIQPGKQSPINTEAFDGKEIAVRVYSRTYKGQDGQPRKANDIAEFADVSTLAG